MELTPETASGYVRHAFDQMLAVAERLGDDLVNERPLGAETNAVAALIIHCAAVGEFWLGHIGCGRPSTRDRDAEFSATASLAELHTLVDATCDQVRADILAIETGVESAHADGRLFLIVPGGDASLVIHVIEELFQHLGHCELAADALLAG